MNYRQVVFSFLFLFICAQSSESAQSLLDHSQWDQLLKKNVHQGLVDYETLRQNRSELDEYLNQLENYPLDSFTRLSREDRLAFWINLYNASMIRMIVDESPLQSISEIPAVFKIRTVRVIGEYFSLSELLNNVLRNGFKDERILTALVSGRMDSPRLLSEAFKGDQIDEQLDRAAHEFAENEVLNQITPGSKKIQLSPLFQQFGADFLLNYSAARETPFSAKESAVIGFLLHHLTDPDKRIFLDSAHYKIEYLPEDPRLNAVSLSKKA